MKQKIDYDMTPRFQEEFYRTGLSNTELSAKIGCDGSNISRWLAGGSIPNPYYLARFHKAGLDVIYILTGERTR